MLTPTAPRWPPPADAAAAPSVRASKKKPKAAPAADTADAAAARASKKKPTAAPAAADAADAADADTVKGEPIDFWHVLRRERATLHNPRAPPLTGNDLREMLDAHLAQLRGLDAYHDALERYKLELPDFVLEQAELLDARRAPAAAPVAAKGRGKKAPPPARQPSLRAEHMQRFFDACLRECDAALVKASEAGWQGTFFTNVAAYTPTPQEKLPEQVSNIKKEMEQKSGEDAVAVAMTPAVWVKLQVPDNRHLRSRAGVLLAQLVKDVEGIKKTQSHLAIPGSPDKYVWYVFTPSGLSELRSRVAKTSSREVFAAMQGAKMAQQE